MTRGSRAAGNPAYRRIMAQALGVIDILVPGQPSEHRLPKQPDKGMPAVPAGAGVGEHVTG